MQRREFLRSKGLARTAGELWEAVQPLRQLERPEADDAVLLRFARRAMATTFEVVFPFATPHAQAWADAALDDIDRLETHLTVYQADSEVSRLNARGANQPVEVAASLFQLLARAQQLWCDTGGEFDSAVGSLIKAWGFFRREGRVPPEYDLADARARAGFEHVQLNPDDTTVKFDRDGVEINLGSIGKGYALDVVIERMKREGGLRDVLVHGGHSSVFALGNEPGSRRGWSVGLLDPDDGTRRLGLLHLRNRGLGVSAATYQHFVHEGRKLGHILDPRTGWPAAGMRLAAATAPTALEADALATAFFVLGVDASRTYCDTHAGVGAILLPQGDDARLVLLGAAVHEFEASS